MKKKQETYWILPFVNLNFVLQIIYYNFLMDKKPPYLFHKMGIDVQNENNLLCVYTGLVLLFAIALPQT